MKEVYAETHVMYLMVWCKHSVGVSFTFYLIALTSGDEGLITLKVMNLISNCRKIIELNFLTKISEN